MNKRAWLVRIAAFVLSFAGGWFAYDMDAPGGGDHARVNRRSRDRQQRGRRETRRGDAHGGES